MIGGDNLIAPLDCQLPTICVVIVAYDSSLVLPQCLSSLVAQTCRPDSIIVVDNNSSDPTYLDNIPTSDNITVVRNSVNAGFCGGNNLGYAMARGHKYILFLNPDAFPRSDMIGLAVQWMENPEHLKVGILTGTLLGFDIATRRPTGKVDSTGVFQNWYGKWYDRDHGREWVGGGRAEIVEDVPAVVGALMFCRSRALVSALLPGDQVFDEKFFMYKEDIDLSIRMRRCGWRVAYWSSLYSYHCRGWKSRIQMSNNARYMSARNELRVCLRNRGKGFLYSALKLAFVPIEALFITLVKRYRRI